MTLLKYFSAFKESLAALAGLGLAPLLLSLFKPDWSPYLFPPMGDSEDIARIGAALLSFIVICCGYLLLGRPNVRVYIASASLTTVACLIAYVALTDLFVRRIDIPSRAASAFVIVGSMRSDFAIKNFAGESDWEMLRERGFREEDIKILWTPNSLLLARLSLYATYLGVLLGWTFSFSGFLAYELSAPQNAGERRKQSRRLSGL